MGDEFRPLSASGRALPSHEHKLNQLQHDSLDTTYLGIGTYLKTSLVLV